MIGTVLRRAAVAVMAGLILGGCLADAPVPPPSPTAIPEPDPTAAITVYALDTSVWYGGLVITFLTATSTLDAKGGPVAVDLTIRNPGAEDATLEGPLLLTAGGRGIEPRRETVLPLVPAGGELGATVVFVVDGAFEVPAAALRIGRSAEHQAIVPLVPGAVPTITLEPRRHELGGSAQAGDLLVTLRAAELRADLPDWGMQLPRGSMSLTLTYDAAYRGDFAGGFAFTTANLSLIPPDGRPLAARADGNSAPAVVIRPRAVAAGLQSRFEVPAPGVGTYRLVVRDGTRSKAIEFAIPGG